ncbi:flagellar export chaperone FliS [Sphingomonas sp. Sphisp140]|uniref:flagellar export chaperone FliS n=1 Tax=unclassified Sphingomonas TaxID=196159 RepID=UPI0039AEE883
MRYASALAANPADTYRQIDIVGRAAGGDPHALVGLLYEEGVAALRTAAWAVERRNYSVRGERVARATAILFALEAGLDFDKGGEVARTLATFYHGLRGEILQAATGTDPAPFREAANSLDEIARAWSSLKANLA